MNDRRGLESSGKREKVKAGFQTAKACRKSEGSRINMGNYSGAEDKRYKHQILHGVLEELLRDWLVILYV
jgi:hypothetical protein